MSHRSHSRLEGLRSLQHTPSEKDAAGRQCPTAVLSAGVGTAEPSTGHRVHGPVLLPEGDTSRLSVFPGSVCLSVLCLLFSTETQHFPSHIGANTIYWLHIIQRTIACLHREVHTGRACGPQESNTRLQQTPGLRTASSFVLSLAGSESRAAAGRVCAATGRVCAAGRRSRLCLRSVWARPGF